MSAVAKAADPKGLKRVCASCGIRFYDMNKRPICCPNCKTEFTGEIKVKGRRSRVVADEVIEKKGKAAAVAADDEDEIAPEDGDTVSLEDLEEDGADDEEDTADADLELDDTLEDLEVEDDLEDLEDDIEVEEEESE